MILAFWVSIGINVVFLILVIAAMKDDGSMPEEWKNEVCRMIDAGTKDEGEKYFTAHRDHQRLVEAELYSVKQNVGYGPARYPFNPFSLSQPDISVSKKLDALYEHLKLEAHKEASAERIIVSKKKGK